MSQVLKDLIDRLSLERIEENLFRGQSQDLGWGLIFGGQVLGQALSAARQTTPDDRFVHSLHAYFLRPGDAKKPVVYDVDRIRDGKSFTTRRVVAIQSGRPIFNFSASFQKREEGFDHSSDMPDVPGPENLKSDRDRWIERLDQIPEVFHKQAKAERPIEIRAVDPVNPMAPEKKSARHAVWVKAAGPVPDDVGLHQYLLAYCSDFSFVTTALRPHQVSWVNPRFQIASIDHAMWFHRPFRIDEWLLHVMESPTAGGARGLVRGQFFTRSGELVASTIQEGLMRERGAPRG